MNKTLMTMAMCLFAVSAIAEPTMIPDGPVDGFGTDLPLDEVVHEIVPASLQIDIAPAVDPGQALSWEGGSSWKAALKSALGAKGLIAKFTDKGVLIDVAPPPPQKWTVYNGETVADAIIRWSKQAGYRPVPQFAAQDRWRIFVDQTFEGSFDEALSWLSKGFSRQPNRPVFYLGDNKTIDIISQPTGMTPAESGQGRI